MGHGITHRDRLPEHDPLLKHIPGELRVKEVGTLLEATL